jgi:hypothetical protein
VAVTDWNGDGIDDVLFQGGATFVLGGGTGAELAKGGPTANYFLPIIYDVDADGTDELTLQGGYFPARTLRHDLTTAVWTGTEDDRPFPYGAVAGCPGGPILVEGSLRYPARLKLTRMSGPSVGTFRTMVLAAGKKYFDEPSAPAGTFLGQLTSATAHANLTGKGHPSALVGSTDGWLYAINPCNGEVDFAVQFDAAVGEAIFADTDGDGQDEILVTVADGFLYGLKNEAIKAPSFVWDIDPDHGITDKDVANIETVDTLSGRWGAVVGASGYSVALLDEMGSFVSSPSWQSVGTATQTSLHGLSLVDGNRYTFAVRALSEAGPSVDAVSDGVTVHLPQVQDAGSPDAVGHFDAAPDSDVISTPASSGDLLAGGGCDCNFTSSSRGSSRLAIALACVAGLLRRWRRRCAPSS